MILAYFEYHILAVDVDLFFKPADITVIIAAKPVHQLALPFFNILFLLLYCLQYILLQQLIQPILAVIIHEILLLLIQIAQIIIVV